jgi:hypothetical protein
MTFADPAAPTGIEFKDHQGALLMFEVLGVEDHVPTSVTKPGEKSPAVRANVTVLDGTNAGGVFDDALVFPKVLQGQLRSRVGQLVLGRLTLGLAKPGQSAPWKLEPATDQDKAKAEEYLRTKTVPQVSSAAASNAEPPF